MQKNKKILVSNNVPNQHWVGNGFYVRGLLRSTEELKKFISPFILLDYASPRRFSRTSVPRGVDVHPHRGFETVTVVYQGEIEHQDSAGGGGVIKPGDVQWMTAGKGIIHKEFHSKGFSEVGGIFEMVQLWINLPQKHKMTNPKYQDIKSNDIPVLEIGKNSMLRLISGEYENENGAASTFTKINLYDLSSKSEDEISISLSSGTNSILLILNGEITLSKNEYTKNSILIFDKEGETLTFRSSKDFRGLLLNGAPIEEPMVAHGPFVMNTKEEIIQAIQDYEEGTMGTL